MYSTHVQLGNGTSVRRMAYEGRRVAKSKLDLGVTGEILILCHLVKRGHPLTYRNSICISVDRM